MIDPAVIPLPVLTDSYKSTHFQLYPDSLKMVAYGEFRQSYEKDPVEQRIVFAGMRYLIENYIQKQWTMLDLERTEQFYKFHRAGSMEFSFPRNLFEKFIRENHGYFPVKIEALPEGTVCYPHVPVYQITATEEYASLCTWLETILTMVWYPTTVASLSRRARQLIEDAFDKSVDTESMFLIESRLHDFGFRGCTSVEQAVIGGSAHLLNFTGTDTMAAAYYVQMHLNNGRPIGQSIPATEHSIMTAWPTEKEAMLNLIEKYGEGLYACVMDSYDYAQALEKLVPIISKKKLEKGGLLVLRPDSGDPIETVLMALRAAEKVFGSKINKKGYKVLQGCAVIQGDGVNYKTLYQMLTATMENGFSAENVAFGMGSGLLQKLNRDTMSFATKLSHITYKDGSKRDIMKTPKTDAAKFSLPGELGVIKNDRDIPIVYPKDSEIFKQSADKNLLKTVYDGRTGFITDWEDFDSVRRRVDREWKSLPSSYDVISEELRSKIRIVMKEQAERSAAISLDLQTS